MARRKPASRRMPPLYRLQLVWLVLIAVQGDWQIPDTA